LHVLYKIWCKQFITHIILVAVEGLWYFGSLFDHDTHYSQRWFTNLLWCDILRKQDTTHRPMSYLVHLYTGTFLWPWEEHRRQRSWVEDFTGQCLLWWLASRKTFLRPDLVFQEIWGWGNLGSFQLPQSNSSSEESWNVGGYI